MKSISGMNKIFLLKHYVIYMIKTVILSIISFEKSVIIIG